MGVKEQMMQSGKTGASRLLPASRVLLLRNNVAERSFVTSLITRMSSSSASSDKPYHWDKSFNVYGGTESEYALGKHRSNALGLISKEPVIEIEGEMAVCDGGGGALGHPVEYIKVVGMEVAVCIYCGLRFRRKDGH